MFSVFSLVVLGQNKSTDNSGIEYRTKKSGKWSDAKTWEYKDGNEWNDLTWIPQENNGSSWLIRANHTVTYSGASHAMPFKDNLTLEKKGKLNIDKDGSIDNAFEIQGQWIIYGTIKMGKKFANIPYLKISGKGLLTIKHTGIVDLKKCGLSTEKASSLVIESEETKAGSLIFMEGDAQATIQRTVKKGRWNMIAPPTEGNTGHTLYDTNADDSWLLSFDESKGTENQQGLGWEYITDLDKPLLLGQGFNYWPDVDETITYTGTIRAKNLHKILDYTDETLGFNLIGNPYTSAIVWNSDKSNWNLKNVEATIWIWNGKTYLTSPQKLSDNIIPMGQGFFVRTNNDKGGKPFINIKQKAKVHSQQDFHKNAPIKETYNYLALSIQNNDAQDEVYIYFDEEGTNDFDDGYDASKMFGDEDVPQLYIKEGDRNQTYDFLRVLYQDETRTISLAYQAGADGEQILSADFSSFKGIEVMLEDLQTGRKQDLKENNTYSFIGSKGDAPERFLLEFKELASAIDDDINKIDQASNIHIYSSQKNIYIQSSQEAINQKGDVFIYDLTGRLLQTESINSGQLIKLSVDVNSSYVVVKVIKDGFTETSQVFIN